MRLLARALFWDGLERNHQLRWIDRQLEKLVNEDFDGRYQMLLLTAELKARENGKRVTVNAEALLSASLTDLVHELHNRLKPAVCSPTGGVHHVDRPVNAPATVGDRR